MNKPAWLLGMTTVLLGGVCLYLQSRPQAGSAPDVQLGELCVERDRLETDVRSLRAAQPGPVLAPPPPPSAAVAAPSASSAPTLPGPILTRPELSLKTRRTMVRMRNGKFFKELGLSDAQVESLLDVLTAQEERAKNAGADPDVRARNHVEVEAAIGREPAQKLDAWQQQLGARMEVRRVRDQLEDVGEPLSDAQLSRINELVHARPPAPPPVRQKDEPNDTYMDRFKTWRNDNREHMRGEVSSVLETRQLERYDELDDLSRAFEKQFPLASMPGPPIAGRAAPAAPR